MRRSNRPRKLSRPECRPTGAGVPMSYRSGQYSEYPQHHPHDHGRASARRPARAMLRCRSDAGAGRLHTRPCRQTGAVRSGCVLDRGRHGDRARHVVGGDSDLFRVPRRRADPADRSPGRDAIRLRRPHRRTARQGRSHHQPSIARSGTIRPEARPDHAPPDHAGIPRHGARRHSGRLGHRIDQAAVARRRRNRHRLFRARQNPRRSATP